MLSSGLFLDTGNWISCRGQFFSLCSPSLPTSGYNQGSSPFSSNRSIMFLKKNKQNKNKKQKQQQKTNCPRDELCYSPRIKRVTQRCLVQQIAFIIPATHGHHYVAQSPLLFSTVGLLRGTQHLRHQAPFCLSTASFSASANTLPPISFVAKLSKSHILG